MKYNVNLRVWEMRDVVYTSEDLGLEWTGI